MKILFLTRRGDDDFSEHQADYGLEKEIAKVADCKWAGVGCTLHKSGEPMEATVKRLYERDDPDWVIDNRSLSIMTAHHRNYNTGVFISDLHGFHERKIYHVKPFILLLNNAGYDAIFMRYKKIYNAGVDQDIFQNRLKAKPLFVPWSVDPEFFKPLVKDTDVVFLGAFQRPYYPIRMDIFERLHVLCEKWGITCLVSRRPPYSKWQGKISQIIDDYWIGKRYAEALGRARIMIFDSSVYRYPIQKFFEAMACRCLVMSDEPSSAKELGLIDRETYVKISIDDWVKKLEYYAVSPNGRADAEEIAARGRKLIEKEHTHYIRAKRFVGMLQEAQNNPVQAR